MTAERYRIGELAKVAGVTVRTLHHYDELGLLVPSERTVAGHRLYDAGDVERLYRLLALRNLGLPLEEIGVLLDGEDGVADTVREHLARVEGARCPENPAGAAPDGPRGGRQHRG